MFHKGNRKLILLLNITYISVHRSFAGKKEIPTPYDAGISV
jgi:hypothetical protein